MASNDYYNQQQDYGQPQSYDNRPPPPRDLPYPWRAEWDARDGRYIFLNPENGERTFECPRGGGSRGAQRPYGEAGASYDGGYGGGQYGGPSGPGGYERPGPQYQTQQGGAAYPMGPQGTSSQQHEQEKKKSGHGWMGAALGAAAGLAGGAFLMHEGEEAKEHFEGDKYRTEERFDREETQIDQRFDRSEDRVEQRFDDFGRDVADAPEDVASWTGRKVGEVEDIPQDIERFGDRVEDVPEDVADWVGDKVGAVEGFGDRVDDAYDDGRDEGRGEDGW